MGLSSSGGVQEWSAVFGFTRLGDGVFTPDRRHDQANHEQSENPSVHAISFQVRRQCIGVAFVAPSKENVVPWRRLANRDARL
jgi:hypothetical protein